MIDTEPLGQEEINSVAEAMIRYGGGFVSHLGEALMRADMSNAVIIKRSFPGYWKHYLHVGDPADDG